MFLCLQIPEVVHIICDELDEDSALSIGMAHKCFLEPALDRRWRHLTSFMPLVACLPDDLLETDEWAPSGPGNDPCKAFVRLKQYHCDWRLLTLFNDATRRQVLRRPLTLSDIKRYLDYYSPRIRSFRPTYEDRATILSLEVLQSLQAVTNWRPGALAPLLTSLTWLSPISDALEDTKMSHYHLCISMFVGPRLTSIEFPAGEEDHLYSSLIYSLTQGLPHLKCLTVCVEAATKDHNSMPFAHSYLVSSAWTKVEEVRVYGEEASAYLKSDTILHLATLPCLTTLTLKDFGNLKPLYAPVFGQLPFDYDPHTGFTFLTHLSLQAVGSSDIVGFLQHLPPSNAVAQLECRAEIARSAREVQSVIQAIQLHGNPLALKHLQFNVFYQPREHIDDDVGGPGTKLEPEVDISPLLGFKQLEYLDIRINRFRITVTPQLIENFGIHWPVIQHLNLTISGVTVTRGYLVGNAPLIDHANLISLLNSCSKLTYLGLRFDARKIGEHPEEDEDLEADTPFHNLKTLNVGDSPISAPKQVALFLEPNISPSCELQYLAVVWDCTGSDGEVERIPSSRTRRWTKVASYLASWAAAGEVPYYYSFPVSESDSDDSG